jgi:hypothetical protein
MLLLECDEMIKMIPCRVVRSRPLGRSREARVSYDFHIGICDFDTSSLQGKSAGDSVVYTRTLGIIGISKYNELAGRLLDCYV